MNDNCFCMIINTKFYTLQWNVRTLPHIQKIFNKVSHVSVFGNFWYGNSFRERTSSTGSFVYDVPFLPFSDGLSFTSVLTSVPPPVRFVVLLEHVSVSSSFRLDLLSTPRPRRLRSLVPLTTPSSPLRDSWMSGTTPHV